MSPKRIAVIGSGVTGAGAIACLKADGLEPICFERTDNFGGTWCYRKKSEFGVGSTMSTTIINHSKEMGAFSDFPPPKEFSNYMKHKEMYQYIEKYLNHHDCVKHIKFNTEVLSVKRSKDYDLTGSWEVTTKDLVTQKEVTEVFDGVLVCTGHQNRPFIPTFPGQELFKGKIMHTHSLKEVDEFQDKNVVVVGIACSATDAAVESSRVAKQVYLSTRSGAYILNRTGPDGYPIDRTLLRRYLTFLFEHVPTWLASWYVETFYINKMFDKRFMPIAPKYHVLSRDPVINDHIGNKLLCGAVKQKGNILKFTENGVVFDGEDCVTEADVIIMATGYSWAFPFIEEGVVVKEGDRVNLYKCMYPPHLPYATLAILGFFNPFGPGYPIGEMQARWASYRLAHDVLLPPKDTMMKEIIKRHTANSKRFCPGERMTVRVDYGEYLDDIADHLGVRPNLLKYLFTDFPLFVRLVFGPLLSYQYRLEGHGKWEGAREAIMTSHERVEWPLSRQKPFRKGLVQSIFEYILNLFPLNINVWKY